MTFHTVVALTATLLSWPLCGPALADGGRGPVVVELFTSQGCASCLAADATLEYLAQRSDVIPLALHVDYWDYIGWKDSFAQPQFTKRQRAYARAAGAQTIYTPQMVIGGQDHVMGNRPMEVSEQIARHKSLPETMTLNVARTDSMVQVDCGAMADAKAGDEFVVQLVRYRPEAQVEILRGENAGKTISYVNIATEWTVVGRWSGKEPLSLKIELKGDTPSVVLVQESGFGPIIAAAIVR